MKIKFLISTVFLLNSIGSFAQVVSGVVLDVDTKEGLFGATVVLKQNKSIGVLTDFDGNFEFKIPSKHRKFPVEVLFSYLGYESQTVWLAEDDMSKPLLIEMKSDCILIDTIMVKTVTSKAKDP
ncbi:MAG: hypothetical protein GC178_02395 [Flavobacteriales bacterium]|nr:hypothetical protein [Flavobacteriales bacterium]